jgi:hypothetical protein
MSINGKVLFHLSSRDTRAKFGFDKLEVLCHLFDKGELDSRDIIGKALDLTCVSNSMKEAMISF